MLGDYLLGGGVQVARPAVIAQSFPQIQHGLLLGGSQRGDARKSLHPTLKIGHHGFQPSLLGHNLRNPNAVRRCIGAPRQGALLFGIPIQEIFNQGD